jgi:hypothetical protein
VAAGEDQNAFETLITLLHSVNALAADKLVLKIPFLESGDSGIR